MVDIAKARRENMRWQILLTLNNARPIGCYEKLVLSVIHAEYPDATQNELRKEIDYLHDRDLVNIDKKPDGRWHCGITRHGVDLVEYTTPLEPGIARPEKYSA